MQSFLVAIDAANPGAYLAVCGVIELVSRLDKSATSAWTRRSGLVPEVPSALSDVCEIHTHIGEQEFASKLAISLGSRKAWTAVTERGRIPLNEAVAEWAAGVEFMLPGCGEVVVIDHWYEWAFVIGDRIAQRHGKRDGKGRWKFWAGQQDKKGITGLLLDLVDASEGFGQAVSVQEIVAFAVVGSSRLNLDAATTRSSIDRGISANDAKKAKGGANGRPGLELLAAVGLSSFFPPRRYGDNAPQGTVGIQKAQFRYNTWSSPAELCLARLCARGAQVTGFDCAPRVAGIGMMGQYKFLRYARPVGACDSGRTDDEDEIDEELVEENVDE